MSHDPTQNDLASQHDAEQLVLAMIAHRVDPRDVQDIAQQLEHGVFQRPEHEAQLRAIVQASYAARGDDMSLALVGAKLAAGGDDNPDKTLRRWGDLIIERDVSGTRAEVDEWVANLLDRAKRRTANEMLNRATGTLRSTGDVAAVLARLAVDITSTDLTTGESTTSSALQMAEMAMERREQARARGGKVELSCGSADLDKALGIGMAPGTMTIFGARPAVGKTVALCDVARAWLKSGTGVLLFSLEMSRADLWDRLMAAETRLPLEKIINGRLNDAEQAVLDRVEAARMTQWEGLLIVEENPAITADDIELRVKQQQLLWERSGITMAGFMVDYIQILKGTNPREEKRVRIENAATQLRNLAKTTHTRAVAAAQINRSATSAAPTLDQLKDSGQLEQDADNVILLHRPELADREDRPGEVDFIIAKARKGTPGQTLTRVSNIVCQTFDDRAYGSEPGTSATTAPTTGQTGGWN